jgi:hypothetical protein
MKDTLLCFIQRDTQKVTELSFLACLESTRDHQKDFEHSRSRAALRLIYAASEGRFGSCCSRQSLLRRPMKGRSRACAKMGAHSVARACDGGGSYRNRSRTKKHTAAATSAGGAYASSSYFGCQVQWALLFPPTTSHITGNCNTLKDNLILSLIRYVVAIKSK